ncbi:hypothetical protein NC653_021721 [Populus alba x Populus x berolinensis]|uniref:Uncharacterized protein n=1 Tax=Populus alba x Populus x berolinensis TaxID=444605 RepID=A0AAD6MP92_9ROSI|nr:hypothetical protein NC653_021721 [Populus alba x Populus x berolinensis]
MKSISDELAAVCKPLSLLMSLVQLFFINFQKFRYVPSENRRNGGSPFPLTPPSANFSTIYSPQAWFQTRSIAHHLSYLYPFRSPSIFQISIFNLSLGGYLFLHLFCVSPPDQEKKRGSAANCCTSFYTRLKNHGCCKQNPFFIFHFMNNRTSRNQISKMNPVSSHGSRVYLSFIPVQKSSTYFPY